MATLDQPQVVEQQEEMSVEDRQFLTRFNLKEEALAYKQYAYADQEQEQ